MYGEQLSVLYGNAGLYRLTSYIKMQRINFVCRRETSRFPGRRASGSEAARL
jgi:hypothetical protein